MRKVCGFSLMVWVKLRLRSPEKSEHEAQKSNTKLKTKKCFIPFSLAYRFTQLIFLALISRVSRLLLLLRFRSAVLGSIHHRVFYFYFNAGYIAACVPYKI